MNNAYVPEDIPSNIYKLKSPFQARITKNERLTAPTSPNDVRHIEVNFEGSQFRYLEGQSVGILPPGEEPETGRPHKLRLYSIASPASGDDGLGSSLSLCVKRLTYTNEAGETQQGLCSNYLCDLPVGSPVHITGPVGKSFLLPPYPNANIIMVGTGTGIAPFRGFLKTRYSARPHETGESHLFFGAQTRQDFLYEATLKAYESESTFTLDTAFSREETNVAGGRMYVQHKIHETRQHMLQLLQAPNTFFYVCGLRGMETGIIQALQEAAQEAGIDWVTLHQTLRQEHRWHIEVY